MVPPINMRPGTVGSALSFLLAGLPTKQLRNVNVGGWRYGRMRGTTRHVPAI